jgi:hypothetical protein
MPSPFPGMNPYLEQDDAWHDFHERLMPALAEALLPQVRPRYIVKLDEHMFIHELPADERRIAGRSDVSIASTERTSTAGATAVVDAPAICRIPPSVDVERIAFIEIRDRSDRQLVTVIEVLSPSNKRPGPDREQYLARRRQLLAGNVHLVELDLLRGGPRLPLEDLPDCDYYALVSRVETRPRAGLWPLHLRDALPTIPVPLRPPDGDAHIDLQYVLHRVYDAAGYEDYIYTGAPQPPLHPDGAAWARSIAGGAGTM